MKKNLFKRGMAGLLSLVMCLTALVGIGTTTAYAAGERAEVYLVSFPRSGDANIDYSGTWGHPNLQYMNGWHSGESKYTTIRAMHSYDGNICYCIEPGVQQDTGDTYTSKDETFWDNLPSDINSTISPYDMKLFIGRIMQYGYTGPISTSWRSQNPADAATLAEAMATQVLIWETVVGERDEDFDYVSPGSYDAVKGVISTAHPLYDLFCDYYDSIEASVQRHSAIPSFMSKNPNRAQSVELEWDGSGYTATLTDHNQVLSDYSFSANEDGISFSVSGNQLIITATDAPSDSVRITANKVGSTRRGVITWTDGTFNQGSGKQDVITYAQSVSDPVQAFLNLKVSYGSAKIVKTSEDGKVDNLTFTVTGNGVNQTVKTNAEGEIQIDNLMPGVYTVTEMDYDKYEPQESRRVTVVSGQVSTVTFNNKLKRGDLQIVKSSEDNLNEGVTFHLYGTSLSGIAVDEYAVTDANGVATFEDVLISGSAPYTVEEVDTAVRYVVPEAQSAPINWNEVTNRSFLNILKKFSVTVTKSDAETGTAQGDASLAGAVYGIYKGETLVDTYTTDKNGQFVTKEYICDNDWTVREITPSEGYLLDTTVHKVGAEPQLYTVEHNQTANDVTEQVAKGNIAIIKHTDNGETQIETPESGAEFAVYLKSAGSYEVAEDTERDYLTCDENGFAQTKDMPYGIYTVHQVSGWEGSEQMPDFDVFISQNGATYRYLINNAPFNSFIKIVKQDAETGKTIPYAGAGFKIYDPDGNPVTMTFTYPTPTTIDVFYTNAEGSLVTPEKLPFGKGYSIVEVQAPYGYVLDETPVYFDVTEDNSTEESGVTVVKVDKPNMAQKGTITVEKTGEVFFGVSVIGGVDESGNELPTIEHSCESPYIQGWKLEMMAEQVFDRYIENADKVMDLSYAMLEKHIADQEELPDNTDVIRRKQGEIEKLMNKRTNLIEMRSEGDIDKEMFRSKKQEIEDRVAKLTEEIKGLQPEKEQTSNEDYSVKLLELRERLKEYTGFDYSVIPESIVEAFIEHIWVSKDEFRWYLRTGNNADSEFDPDDHIKIGAFTLTIDDAKKYIYSFSTRRRVYKWVDLKVSVWI